MKSNKEALKNEEERKERNRSSYSELPEDDDNSPVKVNKKEHGRNKENKEGKGLRKSKSQKERNDPNRFSGDGMNFKAKIIGIDDVEDARGNKMCQDALQKLKAAVKLSGEHKQKIVFNISLQGIRIKNEKTGELLHHHPVHKISFISQDTNDSRAFGYVFGCPQTGHQFFGIKTEKTASQVVCTLRDLFQVALELKKKEIEKAIEHQKEVHDVAEQQAEVCKESKPNGSMDLASENLESEVFVENEKQSLEEPIYSDVISVDEEKTNNQSDTTQVPSAPVESVCVTDNLLDLQFEMDTLQQGITQMEHSIASAASIGFGINFSEDDNSISSGNSFVMTPRKYDRLSSLYHETLSLSSRSSSTSDYNMYSQDSKPEDMDPSLKSSEVFVNLPPTPPPPLQPPPPPPRLESDEPPAYRADSPPCTADEPESSTDQPASTSDSPAEELPVCSSTEAPSTSTVTDRYAVFLEDIDSLPSIFDNPHIVSVPTFKEDTLAANNLFPTNSDIKEENDNNCNSESSDSFKSASTLIFAELDPLGNQPYVDKKEFFHEIKNPPRKVLKDLAGDTCDSIDSIPESEIAPSVFHVNGSKEVPLNENPCNPFVAYEETVPCPPKLPPKRSFSVSSPVPFLPAQNVPSVEEFPADMKNPFNPFLSSDVTDLPPPSSPPPPPPPPRLPTKGSDPVYSVSPPPRPPSRTCGTPTPPLPRRKTPLSSASRAWYSFDQDATPIWPLQTLSVTQENGFTPSSPPLPVPSRKIPQSKLESPLHTSYSASSSPAASRRALNRSPLLTNPATSVEFSNTLQANGACSPQRMFSRHASITQELRVEKSFARDLHSSNVPLNSHTESSAVSPAPTKGVADTVQPNTHSPPLPPKSISRPRPSPSKKMLSLASTSQSSSNSSVSDGLSDSHSNSSLRCMGMDGSRSDSASEFLCQNTSASQSDDIFYTSDSSSTRMPSGSSENGHEGATITGSSTSPDSIFRRLSDPFDDDFFRSLPKKSPSTNGTPASSITEEIPCTNGFDVECNNSKVPPYAQINKFKKEIS